MSLQPVRGVLATVAKAQAVDPEATRLLVEMTLFDVMEELVSKARPSFDRDMDAYEARQVDDTRRAIVREFINKRLSKQQCDQLLAAAADLTLSEGGVSKALFRRDNPDTKFYDGRDAFGRFATGAAAEMQGATSALGKVPGTGYVDPIRNERYKALAGVGQVLGQSTNPAMRATGMAAGAAGALGPEAERVLGRGLKRTAYRYRGTERTANAGVRGDVKALRQMADKIIEAKKAGKNVGEMLRGVAEVSEVNRRGNRQPVPREVGIARFNLGQGYSPDQYRLAVQGDAATDYLRKKLPTPGQTAISIAAGRTPPSVGLMIDADGDVVSEAQGFNGDHFLPFDLKNLKRLQGGQYVRTRAMGGPTVEDVYTGLLTGARQMTVVSNSGVFTFEFDPDVRGGRRYSDRATQMIRRYEQLIGTIDSGELMQQDIDPARKQTLRAQALQQGRGDRVQSTKIYNDLLEEERTRDSFAFQDDDELEAVAVAEAKAELGNQATRGQIGNLADEKYRKLRRESAQNRAKRFQLDADGYAAAMRSLQEEFPFYIRSVRTETLPEFARGRGLVDPDGDDVPLHIGGKDRGHIEHGETNIAVAHGSYGEKMGLGRGVPVNRGGKTDEAEPAAAAAQGATPLKQAPGQRSDQSNYRVRGALIQDKTKPLSQAFDLSDPETREEFAGALRTAVGALNRNIYIDPELTAGKIGEAEAFNLEPLDFLGYLSHRSDRVDWINGLDAQKRTTVLAKLAALPDSLEGALEASNNVEGDHRENFRREAVKLVEMAKKAAPWGEPLDKLDPAARPEKPPYVPEIDELGTVAANYDAYAKAAQTDKRSYVGQLLAETSSESQARTKIITLQKEIKEAGKVGRGETSDFGEPDDPTRRDLFRAEARTPGAGPLTEMLKDAYIVWAYHHGRSMAGGAAPFAPAPQGAEEVGKRLVRRVAPGTAEAVAFQKGLLAARR